MPTLNPLYLLLVDDDDDFIRYVLSVSSYFNVLVDVSRNVKEALKQIETSSYGAYIIDLQLPDGSGFDVIDKARKKGEEPIAAVSGIYHDEESFRRLKEKHGVNYVLGKPIYQDQIEKLFIFLGKKKSEEEPEAPKDKQQQLREYYEKTICDKIDTVTKLIEGVQHHLDSSSLGSLKDALHKIAGSAGTYGYNSVTNICKKLEYEIKDMLESDKTITKDWISGLDHFLEQLKYNFQFPDSEKHVDQLKPPEEASEVRNSLFVLDTDEKFLNLIEREKNRFQIELITESNPDEAKKRLLSEDFNPRAVIVSNSFPEHSFSGVDIIRSMQKKKRLLPTIFGLISEVDDLDLRMSLTRLGIQHFFVKPISPIVFLEKMDKVIPSARPVGFKVLVLDDDQDICKFIIDVLSEIGIDARAINDPKNLYKTLEEFMPHALLLDILLPKYDGLSLLKTLRADPSYSDLAVVIVTHYQDKIVKEVAFSEHVANVMYKPLDKNLLQKNILELARQQEVSGRFHPITSRTGLRSLLDLNANLREIIYKGRVENKYLVLFEMEYFEDFILKQGRTATNKFLVSVGNLLIGSEDDQISSYFIDSSQFALITERESLKRVKEDVREILLTAGNEAGVTVSLCAGIVPISKQFTEPKLILAAAEQTLSRAKQTETFSPVKIAIWQEDGIPEIPKEVLYIDPDTDLQIMLKNALQQHDIELKAFSTGEEALDTINQYHESRLPGLIIAERKMPDMDGLILLDKVKQRFRHPVPFFFLTVYSSDRDILEGEKHGASDYIVKPFNLTNLVEKILSVIYRQSTKTE